MQSKIHATLSLLVIISAIVLPGHTWAQTTVATDTITASTTLTLATSTASTTPVSATTTQINVLLSQIDILKKQLSALVQQVMALGGIGTSTPAVADAMPPVVPAAFQCKQFDRAIGIGMQGEDIKRLQQIIFENDPVFPKSAITGYFGPVTKSAVMRFQAKFGITTPTGFMGPLTRDFINQECVNGGQPQGVIPRMMLPGMVH
ncbi:MAG: protein of unknown function with transrane region [Candidatus Kaiserbacteria bacterium]|nr:protein of unknown function with transrane region [Candidatus Kaiserbacteria bacterium]